MVQNEFIGKVYSDNKFKTNDELKSFKDSFIYHWRYGHHPDFGKDTLFHKPPCVYPIHLRKVHVNIGLYTNQYGYSGTEQCWDDWSTGLLVVMVPVVSKKLPLHLMLILYTLYVKIEMLAC